MGESDRRRGRREGRDRRKGRAAAGLGALAARSHPVEAAIRMRELRVELLSGKKVVDRDGRKVGRIAEIVAEYRGTELIVTEVHVGVQGFAERFSLHGIGAAFTSLLGARIRDKTPAK